MEWTCRAPRRRRKVKCDTFANYLINKHNIDSHTGEKNESLGAAFNERLQSGTHQLGGNGKIHLRDCAGERRFLSKVKFDIFLLKPSDINGISARFRRIAKMALLNSSLHKWRQVVKGACLA